MTLLDNLTRNASARGILPGSIVTVVGVKWHGLAVVGLTYKDPSGKLGNELRLGVNPRIPAVLRSGLPVCNLCFDLPEQVDNLLRLEHLRRHDWFPSSKFSLIALGTREPGHVGGRMSSFSHQRLRYGA